VDLEVPAHAEIVLEGFVDPKERRREGPFGDHTGYYSLARDYPIFHLTALTHRRNPIYPSTIVGRPPQEDSTFGKLVHELFGPLVPKVMRGVKALHAVDAAGVHPLLLAIGSERYVPWAKQTQPMEVLTQALGILGQGQTSLAKYLLIAAEQDAPPSIDDVPAFFAHVLERMDPARDWRFITNTTIDTLDYSGTALNQGSKVIVAGVGAKRRTLGKKSPIPGVLCVKEAPRESPEGFPVVVVCDDPDFTTRTLNNCLWITFTRSNPTADIRGIGEFVENKAWGCRGSIVIDARTKPHHAPVLEEDPVVTARIEPFFQRGGPLSKWGV